MIKNSGMTLIDVREVAFETIQNIKDGSLDLKQANAIKDLLNVVNDVAKTQVAFLQTLPKAVRDNMSITEVKAIAGTLKDRDADLDKTLHDIQESRSIPYQDQK
jgi:hypothetical protein